jgi:hypothetical protein
MVLGYVRDGSDADHLCLPGGEDGDAAKKGKEDTSKKGAAQKTANHIIGEAVMGRSVGG